MGFFNKPKQMNEEEERALEAVREISDERTLKKIAVKSTNWRVRRVAVGKLTDQFVLANIAKSDSNSEVRKTAAGKLEKMEQRMDNNVLEQKQSEQTETQRKAANKKRIIKIVFIAGIILGTLVLMLLPYVITRNEGFPKLLAQIPMFISLILHYILCYGGGITISLLLGYYVIYYVLLGQNLDKKELFFLSTLAIVAVVLGYLLGSMLSNLDYINPFTCEFFSM